MLEAAAVPPVDAARGWALRQLGLRGVEVRGEPHPVHARPWSQVFRLRTTQGDHFLKVSAPSVSFEAALTGTLARLRPEVLPPVVAVQTEADWILMGDGGPTLRAVLEEEASPRRWEEVLGLFAELQLEMSSHVGELLATGPLDYRVGRVPSLLADLVEDEDALLLGRPEGLSAEELILLRATAARFRSVARDLMALGPAETLHHDDFHDGNVFVGSAGYRFFDWGEAGVGHPFCSMVVCLRAIAYRFGLADEGPEMARLRDAYLESWVASMGRTEAHRALRLAGMVGTACRALTWRRLLGGLPPAARGDDATAVAAWARRLLNLLQNGQRPLLR